MRSPANFSSTRAKVPTSSPARRRIELRGRQLIAIVQKGCPFDGEQAPVVGVCYYLK